MGCVGLVVRTLEIGCVPVGWIVVLRTLETGCGGAVTVDGRRGCGEE